MNGKREGAHSQMFTLRVWVEDVGDACAEPSRSSRTEIRGTVKHVLSGETHHFRDWPTLIRYLEAAFASE